jgi:cell fate (sporulation/competence/biofilm development) regulator YlbF (YheA/YmcA/DUF963 family)
VVKLKAEYYYDILEYMEYINDPTNGRLLFYKSQKNTLIQAMNDLDSVVVVGDPALSSEGKSDIQVIKNAFNSIQPDIEDILKLANAYQIAKDSGKPTLDMVVTLRKEQFEIETKFDQFNANEIVSHFTNSQKSLSDSLLNRVSVLIFRLKIGLLVLAGFYMVLLTLIAISVGMVIHRVRHIKN